MRRLIALFVLCIIGTVTSQAYAHQPVMDMAPRWNGGYGAQTRITHANNTTTTWVEGVYTFKPALRMTLKVPYRDGKNGDAIFAMPIKRYKNAGASTSNWGLTPSVRMPTGGGNDWDAGLSLSYSSESKGYYELYDIYRLGDTTGIDINAGLSHADGKGSSWFTLWDISARDSDSGQHLLTGPVLVYFKRNVIVRGEYKFLALDNDKQWDGDYLSIGIGMVF